MSNEAPHMETGAVEQLWATLGEEGKAPTELLRAAQVLPSYSVGIEPWLDRLSSRYLRALCREAAHFKLVLAQYGGGKTHFLLALGARALREGFAVAYVPCGEGVSLDSPLELYQQLVKHLQLPGADRPGLRRLLGAVVRAKTEAIQRSGAPDPEYALQQWLSALRREEFPENAYGRVMAEALRGEVDPGGAPAGEAASRWLQGDVDTLTKDEMAELKLARIPAAARKQFGRNLLLSSVKFCPEAGVHGVVVLLDEVETLFRARGKALLRILAAMRALLDVPAGVTGGLPMLGVFSATPDVLGQFPKYPALKQRLAVRGATFDEGNDFAAQLPLDRIESQETLLAEIGERLVAVGAVATRHAFEHGLQVGNAQRLARVASDRDLDVDARRIFVKTWVNVLNLQVADGERELGTEELAMRYQGQFDSLRTAESEDFEP